MGEKQIKRNCSLKDIYAAKVLKNTDSEYKTDTPYKLARALSAKITDKYNTETLYSDDSVEEVIEQYSETDVEIGVNTLSNEDYAYLYDTLYDNGFLVKSQEDQAQEVALGYRTKRTDGTYDFVWHYAGKFTDRPEQSYETQGEKIKTQTSTLKGVFYARQKTDTLNGKEKHFSSIRVNESELLETNTEAKEAITKWFSEVQEYKEHSGTSVTVPNDFAASVNGTIATQVDVTFSAATGATSVKLQYSNDNGSNWNDVDTTGASDKISISSELTNSSTSASISNLTTGTYSFKLVVDGTDSNIVSGIAIS